MTSWQCDVRSLTRGVHVQIQAHEGERIALVGPNGAGKSTILSALAGHLAMGRQDSVRVRVASRDISADPPGKRQLVYLSQRGHVFEHMSVLANVMYGPLSQGVDRKRARARALELLERVGISDVAKKRASQLSGGQAQRCALARALAIEPSIVALDEPLAALDVQSACEIRELITELLGGRSLVFVSHDPLDIAAWASRVIELADGRVTSDFMAADFRAAPRSRFLSAMWGVQWVKGSRVAGSDFVSDAGVRLPVKDSCGVSGNVYALVDPRDLRLEWVGTGGFAPGPIEQLGKMNVRWIGDVPVQSVLADLLGERAGVHSLGCDARALSPVELYSA